ncbi:hypothetical protein KIN20_023450 [Parelaphostrongylus tenuis]|uniref:Uncharacterized protein n=1 Tax=Parelaphostrongylus tenuis TaxID=148309 RepID=A0AAD5N925_PARTN|nr:hypothetical protein KIN20_023450 [Parelaphostrongylus tenuis]
MVRSRTDKKKPLSRVGEPAVRSRNIGRISVRLDGFHRADVGSLLMTLRHVSLTPTIPMDRRALWVPLIKQNALEL